MTWTLGGGTRPVSAVRRRVDVASLTAGLVLSAFGVALLLDRLGVVDLRFAALAPATLATIGAILFALGVSRSR
jgi:hypothetical protein